jgi:hypothetical protein
MHLLKHINDFLALQHSLLREIAAVHPSGLQSEFLLEIPKNGTVSVEGETWGFQKHGTGLRFARNANGVVIDVTNFVTDANVFDAWRIVQYLESVNLSAASERAIEVELARLEALGDLVRDPNYQGTYQLKNKQKSPPS